VLLRPPDHALKETAKDTAPARQQLLAGRQGAHRVDATGETRRNDGGREGDQDVPRHERAVDPNLGWVELHRGDVGSAAHMFAERDARTGLDAMGDAWTQLNQSALAVARGEHAEGARLYAAGKRKLDDLGAVLDPDDQAELDWLTAQLA
jgi:hypothetical protein